MGLRTEVQLEEAEEGASDEAAEAEDDASDETAEAEDDASEVDERENAGEEAARVDCASKRLRGEEKV